MILLIILGMSLVTIIPRIIPAFVVEKLQFKPWVNRWLGAIPYAALGALIFPGILFVVPNEQIIGIVGGLVAIIIASLGLNVVFVVIGAILTVFLLTL
ncbi:branched-chain amino acid transporter [Oceanobacillus zhaokaii]|uniref:Branched-chain amino acid transporter n=1 Tax=Oceanobacillus zhaokaii TaxID=2052660 RepID=A0A345PFA4_9BACI|nr:AzlD domain-containing protein [Oceanobacillus zhaokaii]AXI08684.1 branched-chain amino acid transporter [Oceanobacillus zhaokaii]